MKKLLIPLVMLIGAFLPAAKADAAIVIHNEGWYLAQTRACLYSTDFHDIGWIEIRSWCYNDNDTALLGNLDVWIPDWMHPVIQAGNGTNIAGRVKMLTDYNSGNKPTNYAADPGLVTDVDHTGPGYQIWYNMTTLPDFGAGSAWWANATEPVELGNSDAQLTFYQY